MRSTPTSQSAGRAWTRSQSREEIVARPFAIPQDLAHQARPDRLTRMARSDRGPAVGMTREVVAGSSPEHREPGPRSKSWLMRPPRLFRARGRCIVRLARALCRLPLVPTEVFTQRGVHGVLIREGR